MTKLILSGCNGRMGQTITRLCADRDDLTIVAGIDPLGTSGQSPYPVFATPNECSVPAQVLVDFSASAALGALLAYGKEHGLPLVLASTGYDDAQLAQINDAAKVIPIFRSANLSVGVNLLMELTRRAAQVLGEDFDVEIVERHHNKKLDAPSGTALMLADAAKEGLSFEPQYVYDRHSVRQQRAHTEIGISAVRGGSIVGDHEVIFAGEQEVVELHHHAASREVFARGALRAAAFMATVDKPGLYSMSDLLAAI